MYDGKWTKEHAAAEAKRRRTELENGTYSFVSRSDVTTLEPAAGPFVDLDLVTPEEAAARLDAALGGFFSKIDEAPRMALRITMGAGKTRGTMRHLQTWLAQQYGQQVEIYVPRHDLADQYVRDLKALDGGICAEIIHHYPRTGGPKCDLPILCLRPDYVRSLEAAKIGVFQAACRTNDGERCLHYDDCPYIAQFGSPDMLEDTRGNVVRIFQHSYLGLPRNPLQGDPDLVIIDEAFIEELIVTDTSLKPADLKRLVTSDRHPKLGRRIVEALEDGEPLLKSLRDEGIKAADLATINLEALRPNVTFAAGERRAIKTGVDAGLYRAVSTMLRLLREELSHTPARDYAERVVYDPKQGEIRLSFLKNLDIPETAAVLLLDATADALLLEQLLGPVTVERIDVSQRAVITQVHDRTGSQKFWEGDTVSVENFVSIANAWASFGETPLIVAHKKLADQLRSEAGLRSDVKVMHFKALRGSNAAETCSVIFVVGRLMPPTPEIDLKARALFWDAAEPLQHDEAGRLKAKDERSASILTQFRGYVQSSRNPHPQSGINVPAFSDARIDALLAQSRDAETMQALGRLRLVHAKFQKRVFLLSNLPVEVPVDRFVPFTDLMPDRLELELIRRGNVPLTPLGLLKMRPDLAANRDTAKNLIWVSMLANAQIAMQAMPILWRTMMVVASFRAGDKRKTDHQHLFLGQQMDSDGIAMVGKVPRPEDIQRLLVEGHPDIPGSGWGEIEDLTVDFLHSGMAMQVSKADLDDAGDEEGNGGGHDYPSP